jgi:hypothetical protein
MTGAASMWGCATRGRRSSEPLNGQRLLVACHKAVSEESLGRLLRSWPGLECLNLKRNRATGKHMQLSSLRCAGGCLRGSHMCNGARVWSLLKIENSVVHVMGCALS